MRFLFLVLCLFLDKSRGFSLEKGKESEGKEAKSIIDQTLKMFKRRPVAFRRL